MTPDRPEAHTPDDGEALLQALFQREPSYAQHLRAMEQWRAAWLGKPAAEAAKKPES